MRYINFKLKLKTGLMETTVNKQELIDWIEELEDPAMLENIKLLKESAESEKDFRDDLPEEAKKAISQAKRELDEGKGIPHDEVMSEVKDRFFKKQ